MKTQNQTVLSFVSGFLILGSGSSVLYPAPSSASIPDSICFNPSSIGKPIEPAPFPSHEGSGRIPGGGSWAQTKAVIGRPIGEVLSELKSHGITKSGRVSSMEIKTVNDPQYFFMQTVHFEVHPFLFVNIEWDENWSYLLLQGTQDDPEQIEVVYGKTRGTSHIDRLCGMYLLNRQSPDTTEISLYEEARATGRSQEDTEKGVKSTLVNLDRKR
jgi:hypothetical protein